MAITYVVPKEAVRRGAIIADSHFILSKQISGQSEYTEYSEKDSQVADCGLQKKEEEEDAWSKYTNFLKFAAHRIVCSTYSLTATFTIKAL